MQYRYLFPGMPDYPPTLHQVWPGGQLPVLTVSGNPEVLRGPLVGFLSSTEVPPDLFLPAFDLAMRLNRARVPIAGGFQGEVERTFLSVLLRGDGPLVICPARSLDGMIPAVAAEARRRAGTIAYASAERPRVHRPTAQVALRRNDLVVGVATRLIVLSAPPGSSVLRRAAAVLEAGRAVACFDHRRNRDLLLLGAVPIRPTGRIRPASSSAALCPEVPLSASEHLLSELFTETLPSPTAATLQTQSPVADAQPFTPPSTEPGPVASPYR